MPCDRTNGVRFYEELPNDTLHERTNRKTQSQLPSANRPHGRGEADIDFKPVVKLFPPNAQCTCLLTDLGNNNIAFGLCDLGLGMPEIGFVCVRELEDLRGPLGLPIERDEHFEAAKTLSAYAEDARAHRRIVT